MATIVGDFPRGDAGVTAADLLLLGGLRRWRRLGRAATGWSLAMWRRTLLILPEQVRATLLLETLHGMTRERMAEYLGLDAGVRKGGPCLSARLDMARRLLWQDPKISRLAAEMGLTLPPPSA